MGDPIVKPERETQNRIISLLKSVHGYRYIGNLADSENTNIRNTDVLKFLIEKQGRSQSQANEALRELEKLARCGTRDDLYNTSKDVYRRIRYRVSVRTDEGKSHTQISFIDWEHPERNDFAIAEEVTVRREIEDVKHRRPDVVIYVNGIALVVLELKRDDVSVSEAIRQNFRNQEDGEIFQFFSTVQLIMAGNGSEGLHYGVIKTPEKYYLKWKEPTGSPCDASSYSQTSYPNELDRSILQMLEPKRLLEFIHDFIIFDAGIKKAARPNQYFAIKAAQKRIAKREGGIIWHSQGSGKSLTMVWLAQWIKENCENNPRVLIITDRDELDKQIENGFKNTNEKPKRVKSGSELVSVLNSETEHLICTLIHKFGANGDSSEKIAVGKKTTKPSVDEYLQNVAQKLPGDFRPKGNIFVFVDECHRTQGGMLHEAMKRIIGKDVMVIGFTGTPLLNKDKKTSQEQFGSFIHTYKFDEAVDDGVILDLRYEARDVEQVIDDENSLDAIFDSLTQNMSPKARDQLQTRWASLKNLYSSHDRMKKIVGDICKDMFLVPALNKGYGNAMLVAGEVYQAYKYWDLFQNTALKNHCAVVSSYDPAVGVDLTEGHSDENDSMAEFKNNKAKEMMGKKTAEQFEEWAKAQFIECPADMKLLIVVDKLLTGFDAPSATYLYIDKKMENHNLFQAICRVNRVNGDNKDFGFIIDYKDLFNEVKEAIEDYTKGGFAEYSKGDIEGLLKNRLTQGKKDLDGALEKLALLIEPVKKPKSIDDFYDYFVFDQKSTPIEKQEEICSSNRQRREIFYDAVANVVRKFLAIATQMTESGYTPQEAKAIHDHVQDINKTKDAILLRSGDSVDLSKYGPKMRELLDQYVGAKPSEILAKLDDFSFLELIRPGDDNGLDEAEEELGGKPAMAETLAANARRVINRKHDQNPEEYRRLSEKLNRILADLKDGKVEYKKMLLDLIAFCRELKEGNSYPGEMDTEGKKALYDNLGRNAALVMNLCDNCILPNAEEDWRNHPMRRKKLKREVKNFMDSQSSLEADLDQLMKIIESNGEF